MTEPDKAEETTSATEPVAADAATAPTAEPAASTSAAASSTASASAAKGTPTGARPFARLALAFAAGVLALGLVLLVQHLRHGWPFSLHHGRAADGSVSAAPPMSMGDAGVTVSPRVAITLAQDRLEGLGVELTTVMREPLASELRAVATVVPDESRVSHVHTRVSGWIDRLSVRTTGESVRAGEMLGSIFSRELLASQTEYLTVLRTSAGGTPSPIARGARERLGVLGMTEGEIATLERRGTPTSNVPIPAPRSGVVLHRGVSAGAAVDPSTELFVIADLSIVWVLAEVPESRMGDVHVGSAATIEIASTGIAPIEAIVAFMYPTLTEGTRTLRVRFVLDNAAGELRPGTYGNATFHLEPRSALVVPRDAILDTGIEQHVFVATGQDRFEPRTVHLGARLGDLVEVIDGVAEGERVVASGVFLLDSESRLRASGSGHAHGDPAPASHAPATTAPADDMSGMPGMGH